MFAPLLEAYIASMHLPPCAHKPPLVVGFSICPEFRAHGFEFILSSAYELSYHNSPFEPCDLAFGASFRLEGYHKKILDFSQKRVGYTGENERINFDIYDFGMGFDHLHFHERYLRVPLYYLHLFKLYNVISAYQDSPFGLASPTPAPSFGLDYPHLDLCARQECDFNARAFASFVASNSNAPVRNHFYQELSAYAPVAGGGKVFNTTGEPVANKWDFLSRYKFNLCFENTKGLGYTTEKIIDAYFAHTIPIYWGNPEVAKDFNPKSFVNAHDFKDFKETLDFVRYLDTHSNAYLDMLYAHPLNNYEDQPSFYNQLSFSKILAFLQNAIACQEIYHEHCFARVAHTSISRAFKSRLHALKAYGLKGFTHYDTSGLKHPHTPH
ncbi:glycosyltransferase family 10 domain-containing protein [Helicobacter labacensis]|uniref:glycosyltransferase family 10 domain-containing protein n=1 Tax=Helicobacter labacensis TaxID=2316079 RepID=UPI001968F4FC|nr:glycosyltransferase family 10 [Helicobacter labacensis]